MLHFVTRSMVLFTIAPVFRRTKNRVSHPPAVYISKRIKMQDVLDVPSFLKFSGNNRKRKAWPQLFFGCNKQV